MAATHNGASAQQRTNPSAQPPRSEFYSYELREDAAAGAIAKSQYYNSIPTAADQNGVCAVLFDAPYAYGDRNVFFRTDGSAGAYQLFVNNRLAGGSVDAYTPSEVCISPYLVDGLNDIRVVACESGAAQSVEAMYKGGLLTMGGNCYIMSQPKVYIEDFDIKTSPDSTGNHGLLDLHIVVRNSSRADQHLSVGFDIYDPKGKLKTYDLRELDMTPGERDTVRFHNIVYSTAKYLWSAEKPNLYALTMYIKQYGSITEYVPWPLGWGTTTYTARTTNASGVIMRNDVPVEMRAVEFCPYYKLSMEEQVRQLKRKGYNTIVLSKPAQIALYRACDKVGMYVIDCPAISADPKGGSRARHNGTALNNPDYLDEVLYRTLAMQRRTRNHSCVVAWSLAAGGGNGYNLYKSYQLLHTLDTLRPAVYRFAEGEWNNDLVLPNPEVLE